MISELYIDILDVIQQAWKELKHEYERHKVWWSEKDVVAVFYHLIRPTVDLIPQYELYWEWYAKFHIRGSTKVDLVLVETTFTKEKFEGHVRVAMEFKWTSLTPETERRINRDAENLTILCQQGYQDKTYDFPEMVLRINRGTRPDNAILFIVDVTKDKEQARSFYEELKTTYPMVKILYYLT